MEDLEPLLHDYALAEQRLDSLLECVERKKEECDRAAQCVWEARDVMLREIQRPTEASGGHHSSEWVEATHSHRVADFDESAFADFKELTVQLRRMRTGAPQTPHSSEEWLRTGLKSLRILSHVCCAAFSMLSL